MKKLIALTLFLSLLVSCSIDDDNQVNYGFEVLPVESVDMPEAFVFGETYPINVSYFRPSSCHFFNEFYYVKDVNQRTVAPITVVYDYDNCETLKEDLVVSSFNFVVTSKEPYVFKFWQGEDDNGNDVYLTIEVPVTEEN